MLAWSPPPPHLGLAEREAHAWLIPIDIAPQSLREARGSLSQDEQVRADRFVFERDRIRYVAARAGLRRTLARYLGVAPRAVTFSYSPHGKPSLADESAARKLSFNLSHSGDWAVLGIAAGPRIGVDIEQVRPRLADETIAERFFSPREVAALRSLPPAEQAAAFFRCWTRKEAFVKALGEGLSFPLDRFDVSLLPDEPPALLRTLDDATEAARWSVRALPAPPGYEASIVVEERESPALRLFLESS